MYSTAPPESNTSFCTIRSESPSLKFNPIRLSIASIYFSGLKQTLVEQSHGGSVITS